MWDFLSHSRLCLKNIVPANATLKPFIHHIISYPFRSIPYYTSPSEYFFLFITVPYMADLFDQLLSLPKSLLGTCPPGPVLLVRYHLVLHLKIVSKNICISYNVPRSFLYHTVGILHSFNPFLVTVNPSMFLDPSVLHAILVPFPCYVPCILSILCMSFKVLTHPH